MPWETAPENSQRLTSHLPSNTCSSAPHIFCQESTLLGLLPQPTGRSQGQKYTHGVVLKILTSRVHDEAKPKPDILGRGWGPRQGTECLPDPLTPGGKIHSRKKKKKKKDTLLGTPSAVVCCKRHRLSVYQTEGQLGSCPTRHTSWQKRKSFFKSPAHLHMSGSLKVAGLGSILELF